MIIGILKESGAENRVAMLPGEAAGLKKLGVEVIVETMQAKMLLLLMRNIKQPVSLHHPGKIVFSKAALLLSVNPVPEDDLKLCREGTGTLFSSESC